VEHGKRLPLPPCPGSSACPTGGASDDVERHARFAKPATAVGVGGDQRGLWQIVGHHCPQHLRQSPDRSCSDGRYGLLGFLPEGGDS
jgi:hypothetical protein